jgi:hypothetical protein
MFGYHNGGFRFYGGGAAGSFGSKIEDVSATLNNDDSVNYYTVQDGGPSSESSDGSCTSQGSNGGPNSDPRQGPDSSGKPQSLCLPATEAG